MSSSQQLGYSIWNPYTPCGRFTVSIPQGSVIIKWIGIQGTAMWFESHTLCAIFWFSLTQVVYFMWKYPVGCSLEFDTQTCMKSFHRVIVSVHFEWSCPNFQASKSRQCVLCMCDMCKCIMISWAVNHFWIESLIQVISPRNTLRIYNEIRHVFLIWISMCNIG